MKTKSLYHVVNPRRSQQLNLVSMWINSSWYLFSRFFHSVEEYGPYFTSGAMARALWFVKRTKQLSNCYQHEQWATTSRSLELHLPFYNESEGSPLEEGCYQRVNLLQSTEVEFLSLVKLSKFIKNNFPCDWGSHERGQKKLCIGTYLRTLLTRNVWLQSPSCFSRMENR